MHHYIIDTEFAVQSLLHLTTEEESKLAELAGQLKNVEAQARVHQWD